MTTFDTFDTPIATRVPAAVDERLRLAAVLHRQRLSHVLAHYLDRVLRSLADLAAQVQADAEPDKPQDSSQSCDRRDRMITTVAARFPGIPESVRAARAMVRVELGDGHPAADAAALCVSELVTNAITYTRSGRLGGTVLVAIETWSHDEAVVLRVWDGGGTAWVPHSAKPAVGAEHGYGLLIVAAAAEAWGTHTYSDGICTWCRITREDARR